MGTGQEFVKKLRPVGCALFLGMFVLVTVVLFTAKGSQVPGYTAPNSSEYYAAHLDELKAELEENFLPLLDVENVTLDLNRDVLLVSAQADDLQTVRLGLIHYYDTGLFEFKELVKE